MSKLIVWAAAVFLVVGISPSASATRLYAQDRPSFQSSPVPPGLVAPGELPLFYRPIPIEPLQRLRPRILLDLIIVQGVGPEYVDADLGDTAALASKYQIELPTPARTVVAVPELRVFDVSSPTAEGLLALKDLLITYTGDGRIPVIYVKELRDNGAQERGASFKLDDDPVILMAELHAKDTLMHEIGHTVGLPDDYLNPWSLMADGRIRVLPNTLEDLMGAKFDRLTVVEKDVFRTSPLLQQLDTPEWETVSPEDLEEAWILPRQFPPQLGPEQLINNPLAPAFRIQGINETMLANPEPGTLPLSVFAVILILCATSKKHRGWWTKMFRFLGYGTICGLFLSCVPLLYSQEKIQLPVITDLEVEGPAMPPVVDTVISLDGRFRFVVEATDNRWSEHKCKGLLFGPSGDSQELFWSKVLPHQFRPRFVGVSNKGYTITFDEWELMKSRYAITVWNPSGVVVKNYSFDDLVSRFNLNEKTVFQHSTEGLWMSSRPTVREDGNSMSVGVAGRTLHVKFEDGSLELK